MIRNKEAVLSMIGARVSAIRRRKGLRMKDVAEKAELGVNTIIRVEGGDNVRMGILLSCIAAIDENGDVFREIFNFSEEDKKEWEVME